MVRFAGTIARYAVAYDAVIEGKGSYDDEGKYIRSAPIRRRCFGAIQPISARVLNMDGSRYTSDDRTLYTTERHQTGDILEYAGRRYRVEEMDDRSDYADFFTYRLKWVNGHAV